MCQQELIGWKIIGYSGYRDPDGVVILTETAGCDADRDANTGALLFPTTVFTNPTLLYYLASQLGIEICSIQPVTE